MLSKNVVHDTVWTRRQCNIHGTITLLVIFVIQVEVPSSLSITVFIVVSRYFQSQLAIVKYSKQYGTQK
jgi:hypothetical protein